MGDIKHLIRFCDKAAVHISVIFVNTPRMEQDIRSLI